MTLNKNNSFTSDQFFSLIQSQAFFDWYCDGGDYQNWLELGPEESGVDKDKLIKWLEKELSKRKTNV